MSKAKISNQNNNINDSSDSSEDEIILNEDDFGTIGDLIKYNGQNKNNNKSNKITLKLNNNKEMSNHSKPIIDLKFISENPSINRKYDIKDENTTNYQAKKLRTDLMSDKDKILSTNDENSNFVRNNSEQIMKNLKNSKLRTNKTVFSKIAENLYDINIINLNKKNNIFGKYNQDDDYYDRLTVENYLISYATKSNCDNQKKIEKFIERNTKNKIIDKKKILGKRNLNIPLSVDEESSHNHSYRKRLNTEKKTSRKNKSPDEFLLNQKKYELMKKLRLENLKLIQNNLSKATIKDRPTISKISERILTKRTYNMLTGIKQKNIHLKLYEDFEARKKNMAKLQRNSYSYNSTVGNKKLSPDEIKEATNRLYNEYMQKEKKIKDNKEKNLIYYRNLSSMPFINKKSENIITSKFINKYKLVLSFSFNKTINDIFDINYNEFINFMKKIGMIDTSFIENDENNKKETEIKNTQNSPRIIEFKAISAIWREHTDLKINNNCQNLGNENENKIEINNNKIDSNTFNFATRQNLSLKKKLEEDSNSNFTNSIENETQKLIKESWKIITNNKIFNKELYANSFKVLLFCLSVLGIYKGDINIIIKKEFPFLLSSKIKMDNNLCRNIYKNFAIFRKFCISNLISKKRSSVKSLDRPNKITKYIIKRKIIKNQPKMISVSPSEIINKIKKDKNQIKNINKKYVIKEKIFIKKKAQNLNKSDDEKTSKTEIFNKNKFEDNTLSEIEKKYKNKSGNIEQLHDIEINNSNDKNATNNKISNNSNLSSEKKTTSECVNTSYSLSKKKKFKFVFQVKIGEENKKLIINENQNIKEKVDEFCLENELDEYEKQQIIEVVNRKFLQKQIKNKY